MSARLWGQKDQGFQYGKHSHPHFDQNGLNESAADTGISLRRSGAKNTSTRSTTPQQAILGGGKHPNATYSLKTVKDALCPRLIVISHLY